MESTLGRNSSTSLAYFSSGFTVIELVIVLALIGIVSAVAMSRMLSANAANAIIAREQIISSLRSAQQRAIGRSDVVFSLQPVGETLQIRLSAGTDEILAADIGLGDLALRGDVNQQASCAATPGATLITNANPMVIDFDSLGNIVHGGVVGSPGYPVDVTTGMRVCVNGDPTMSVCLSAVGFAYAGNCDD